MTHETGFYPAIASSQDNYFIFEQGYFPLGIEKKIEVIVDARRCFIDNTIDKLFEKCLDQYWIYDKESNKWQQTINYELAEAKRAIYKIEILKIKSFVNTEYQTLKKTHPAHFKRIKTEYESSVRYFKWNTSKQIKLYKFFYLLKENRLISGNTSFDSIVKAFSYTSTANKSLNIIWLPKRANGPDKVSLIYLLHQLANNGYLKEDIFDGNVIIKDKTKKTIFNNKIALIFCDQNGNHLKNIKNSFDLYKNQCPLKTEIDLLIKNLKIKEQK